MLTLIAAPNGMSCAMGNDHQATVFVAVHGRWHGVCTCDNTEHANVAVSQAPVIYQGAMHQGDRGESVYELLTFFGQYGPTLN